MILSHSSQGCLQGRITFTIALFLMTHLMRMLDMNTKSQLLQYPPFCFDYLIFGVYVVLIKYQGAWSPIVCKK